MRDISDERLETIAKNALSEERRMMATELLALRKERELAEPVAWRHDDGPFAGGVLTKAKSVAEKWIAKGWKVTPLYAAPPAPVAAPDLHKVIYHFKDLNEGFPVERFKADYVIAWMLANYPPTSPC